MKKQYNTILFDLDGTIADSGVGVTKAVEFALNQFGITVDDRSTLFSFIGPPLTESFMKYYYMSVEEADEAVLAYRVYYEQKGMLENTIYEGIEELLKQLHGAGKTIVLATSKPEVYAVKILQHTHLDQYFTIMAGASMDGTRIQKYDVIQYALSQINDLDLLTTIMIGDRHHDITGANRSKIDSIGVLFGYGCRDELKEAKATYIAATAKDIGELLLI